MADLRQDSSVFGELLVTGGGASLPVHVTGGDVDAGTDYDLLKINDVGSGTVLRLNTQADASLFEVAYTGTIIGNSYTLPHSAPAEGQLLTRATGAGAGVLSWENPAAAPFTADLDDVLNNTTGNSTSQALTTGAFKATSININSAFMFPTADGTSGQVLQTDGSGTVTWEDAASGGADDQTLDEVLTEGSTSTQSATLGGLDLDTTIADGSDPTQLTIRNTSASPAINDVVGSVVFKGDNLIGTEVEFARLKVDANAVTNGGERGELALQVRNSGGSMDAQIKVNGVVSFYDDAYSFPITDGTAAQAMFTDGAGAITWNDAVKLLLSPTSAGSGQIPMTVAGSWYPSFWTLPTTGGSVGQYLTTTSTGVSGWETPPTPLTLDTTTDNGATTTNSITTGVHTINSTDALNPGLQYNYTGTATDAPNGIVLNSDNLNVDNALPTLTWSGPDSADNLTYYGGITCVPTDKTNGSEDSYLSLGSMQAGTFVKGLSVAGDVVSIGSAVDGTEYTMPNDRGTDGEYLRTDGNGAAEWATPLSYAVEILSFDQTTNAARYIPWGSRAESTTTNATATSTFACTHDTILTKIALRFESDPGACTIRVQKLTSGAGATTTVETISFTPSTTVGEINVVSFTSASTFVAGDAFLLEFGPTNVPNDVTGSITLQLDPTS